MRRTRVWGVALGGIAAAGLLISNAGVAQAALPGHRPIVSLGGSQSGNWSGYNISALTKGKPFTSVAGSWTVPTATQHKKNQAEHSSAWIGIGGGCLDSGCTLTDPTLIQTGTEQDVAANGTASYSAWWEIIPEPSTPFKGFAVRPGDSMSASIVSTAPGQFVITLKDLTTGKTATQSTPYSSTGGTAEWIVETPLVLSGPGTGFAAMPNLSTVHFDKATANGANPGLTPANEIQLVNGSTVVATPSSPDPDTDGFNDCTWASSCPAPSSS